MIATHVLAPRTTTGELALGQSLAGGRASALFAVLAGVSIALMTGRQQPVRGRERAARAAGLAVRALLIALIGLFLGGLETGLAIILTYYGVLFLLGTPFLGLRARSLALLAAGWVVVAPVVSQVARPYLPERGTESPSFQHLAEPGRLLGELLFTGYYPAVPWLAYLLAGMALGRLDLRHRRTQVLLAAGGVGLAVLSTTISHALTGRSELLAPQVEAIEAGMFGTTPTGGPWEWLLVVAPHSGTPFDLAQTIGSSLAVIGTALLVVQLLPRIGARVLAVLFGAGTMTLTLYSLHAVMRTGEILPDDTPETFVTHLLVVLGLGALYTALGRRGPLERLVSALAGGVARRVRGPASPVV